MQDTATPSMPTTCAPVVSATCPALGGRRTNEHGTGQPIKGVDLGRLLAVLPGAVDEAMRKALPGYYAPEKAAQIAAGTIANLCEEYRELAWAGGSTCITVDGAL